MNIRARLLLLALAASLASLTLVTLDAGRAGAVATRSFELDDAAELAAGELTRTAVHSDGRVTAGVELRRLAMPEDVALVWSSARAADGTIYLGTGNDGRVYRLRGDAIELHAETGQLLVSALAVGDGGVLYAGTLPEGRIYAIEPGGAVRELARPDAAEHVWALVWDPRRRVLFAATGPEGRVYSVAPSGDVQVWWDSSASHVMSLALADDGALYAGTSDDAIVVRTTAPGRAEVVHDFPGNEITSLAWRGGRLAVAANEFPDAPAVSATGSSSSTKHSATAGRATRPRPGKARVWSVGADGRAERVWAQEEGHATQVQLADDGTIYAAIGHDGRVVRVAPDRTSAVWIDVDERQVLSMDLVGSDPYLTTGDGAAVYRVLAERPRQAIWQSKVLDADFPARWGQLTWRGAGRIELQTRSGNTERPDDTWSEWSSALASPGPIRSPAARFLQLRAVLAPDATLRAVTAFYLPQNQRPVVTEVGTKARTTKRSGTTSSSSTTTEARDPDALPSPSPSIVLTWRVDNPDSDRLRYRLRYREESQQTWRDILREHETLTATEHTWNTSAVPDGWYVVRVEASDELGNPAPLALRSTFDSQPILVDNHAPVIDPLGANGARVTGRAVDTVGPIARLEHAVDGGEWEIFFPTDDLLDTRDERFELDLSSLGPGPHIVAVRATDAAGNVGSAEIEITVPGSAVGAGGGAARGRRAR